MPPAFFTVLPAAFLVVFVFFAAFFLAAIRNPPAEVVTTATAELPLVSSEYLRDSGRACDLIYMTYMVTYVTCQTKKLDG